MAQAIADEQKVSVVTADGAQTLCIPDEFRFSSEQVYIRRDPQRGVVEISEKPFRPTLQEVWAMFDALDLSDFEIERDHSLPRDIDL